MIRQRVHLHRRPGSLLVRLLMLLLIAALIYGGVLDALLALKVSSGSIEQISGYRSIYNWLAGLHRGDFTTAVSLIAGFTGLLVFIFCLFLAEQSLPRPQLARTDVGLQSEGGATLVRPRAIERIAEVAARGNDHVMGVTGRYGDEELNVDVGLDDPTAIADALRDVRRRVAEDLERHHLSPMPVNVTLTGYEPTRRDP